jgi:hypothetical protein
MKLHKDSHVDHGLSKAQLDWLLEKFASRDAFFIETVVLPSELGTVPCGLYGPEMGDNAIEESSVVYGRRGNREYKSRLLNITPLGSPYGTRAVNIVTVIAGPHDDLPCVLFTAFGGPLAPKEPNDPTLKDDEREKSVAFWLTHALAK